MRTGETALRALFTPGEINQDLSHRLSGNRKEVRPIMPAETARFVSESEPSLVDQRGGLENVMNRVPWAYGGRPGGSTRKGEDVRLPHGRRDPIPVAAD